MEITAGSKPHYIESLMKPKHKKAPPVKKDNHLLDSPLKQGAYRHIAAWCGLGLPGRGWTFFWPLFSVIGSPTGFSYRERKLPRRGWVRDEGECTIHSFIQAWRLDLFRDLERSKSWMRILPLEESY